MSNVILGKFGGLDNLPDYFTQEENGDVAAIVAIGLNEEIDSQGMCEVEIYYYPEDEVWLIDYSFPNGYGFGFIDAGWSSLEDANCFMVACNVASSDIENKSIRCLTPFDPDEAEEKKISIKYRIKKDIIGVINDIPT